MRKTLLAVLALTCSGLWAGEAHSQLSLDDAWSAWRKGDIENAEEIAAEHVQTDEGRHLLALCACVKANYAEAEEHHRAINQSYDRLDTGS